MPTPRRHLLLPSEKGLVQYDLLEETAFLGVGPRGSILASPKPFPEAKIVLSDDGRGFVARAMPGEAPPEVNGSLGTDVRLGDGARVRVGELVALFRSPELPPVRSSAPSFAPATPRPRPAVVPAMSQSAGSATRALTLLGAMLLLFAAYQTVRYLDSKGADPVPPITAQMFEAPAVVRSTPEESAHQEVARLLVLDTGDVTRLEEVFDGYAQLARTARGTESGLRAAMRVHELRPKLAEHLWKAVSAEAEASARSSRFRSAIAMLEGFEARFAGTEPGRTASDRIEGIRVQAREALDALAQRAAPLLGKDPTRAYRLLTTTPLELPADLAEELAALMARVREAWGTSPNVGPTPPTVGPTSVPASPDDPPRPPTPTPPTPPPRPPGGGAFGGRPQHGPRDPDPQPPPTTPADKSAAATALWKESREHLAARRFQEARDGYTRLQREFANAEVVRAHPERVKAGRKAADIGLRGPVAFFREEATFKDGKLECEWSFDDDTSFLEDFTLEQVFPAVDPAECAIRSGQAILSGSTAILANVVYDVSSLYVEADCIADAHRDYGLIGRQESKDIRAVLLEVGNTQFKLKKGPDGKVLGGHVLWLFGDGVWKDADKGAQGFIRLAEQLGNTLKSGERLRLDLEVLGDKVEGSIHSKTDPAILKGPLKGDDGKGMTSMRAGAFAYKGRVGIERLKIVGKVDESWALEEFQRLVKADTGPE